MSAKKKVEIKTDTKDIKEVEKVVKKEKKKVTPMALAMRAIKKKYGDVIKPMSERPLTIDTISTRSIGIDVALGRGGFAKKRIYEVYGPNSGGKTTLSMSLLAEAQSRGMTTAFIDAEHSADPSLFLSMGVDLEKLQVIDLYTGEKNLDAGLMLIQSGQLDLLVIDSVTSLLPQVQETKDVGETTIALLARLMSSALLKYVPAAAEHGTCVVFINQIRYKVGGYGDPETTPAGESLKFYSTGRLRISGVGAKKNRIVDEAGVVIGHKAKFDVKKNKLAAPFTSAEVDLIYGSGYDMETELVRIATDLGIVVKKGGWYSYGPDNIGHGEHNVKKFFLENKDVYQVIRDEVTDLLGVKQYYDLQKKYDFDNENKLT